MRGRTVIALLIAVGVLTAGAVQAADWQKIGSGTLVFKNPQLDIKAKKSVQPCSQIRFKAAGTMISVTDVKIYFTDGSSQDVEFKTALRPGVNSEPIDIDGGPKTVEKIEIHHSSKGNSGSLRAQVTVQGAA